MSGFQENNLAHSDERYRSKIHTLQNLPTLPHLLLEIIQVCNEQKGDFKELSGIIEKDPSMSVKVLRMANSPYYGLLLQSEKHTTGDYHSGNQHYREYCRLYVGI